MGINQFQAAAAAGGPFPPASARAIGHLIFDHQNGRVGVERLWHRQREQFAVVRQLAAIIAHRVTAVQIRILGKYIRQIARHDQITVRCERDIRKGERDARRELPAGQVHGVCAFVVEFNVLVVVVAADRLVHQFIDDNVTDQN